MLGTNTLSIVTLNFIASHFASLTRKCCQNR